MPSPFPAKDRRTLLGLMQTALGREPADLVIENARLVNVFTGEIEPESAVAVRGPWIARVARETADVIGPHTRRIDAAGRFLTPGLIDAHTHLAWIACASQIVPYAIASGVTTMVTETLEPYPVAGLPGVLEFLASLADQPIRFLATAPAMVSISTAARGVAAADLEALVAREEVLGLGESYWQAVLQDPAVYLPAIETALAAGKLVEGHSAGAAGNKLAAYLALGVSSCHEPIDAPQALSRLRAGVHVLAREGGIRRDLAAIAKIRQAGVDLRRLALASDGLSPRDWVAGRGLDAALRCAIASGIPPLEAVRMATLHPAEHFRLDSLLGAVAPGRLADLVLTADLADFRPETVICGGRILFEAGRLACSPRRHAFSWRSLNTVHLPRRLTAEDFRLQGFPEPIEAEVRVIELVSDLVTAERHLRLPVREGELRLPAGGEFQKVAAVDRAVQPGKLFTGVLRGFGLSRGAVACSAAWDGPDIVVVGTEEEAMAAAVNRVAELQGGAVLRGAGVQEREIPLPVFGLAADRPLAELAAEFETFNAALRELGANFPDPLLTLVTLTGAAIPYLRICEEGLVNLRDGRTVGLRVGG